METPAQPNVRLQWNDHSDVLHYEIQGERLKGVWSFWQREKTASEWNPVVSTDALIDMATGMLTQRTKT